MKSRQNIERALVESLLRGLAVSIKLKDHVDPLVTVVVDFDTGEVNSRCIEIKPHTLYGYPATQTRIPIDSIEDVILLTVYYSDPLYVRLREMKLKILGDGQPKDQGTNTS